MTVAFLDAPSGAVTHQPAAPVAIGSASGIDGTAPRCGIAFGPGGATLAAGATVSSAGGATGAIQLLQTDAATGTVTPGTLTALATPPSAPSFTPCPAGLAFTASGALIADGIGFGQIGDALNAWTLRPGGTTATPLTGSPLLPVGSWTPGPTALSGDGSLLAAAVGDGVALASLDPPSQPVAAGPTATKLAGTIGALAISPTGRLLAAGDASGRVSLLVLR